MEKGDIGVSIHSRIACWFEGLVVTVEQEPVKQQGLLSRIFKKDDDVEADDWVKRTMSLWRINEMPLRSLIHLRNQLGIAVDVYTYYDDFMVEHIESYLARKGADCQVYSYNRLEDLVDDMRYNREVHTLFTPYEEDAKAVGWHRATVVNPEGRFGY